MKLYNISLGNLRRRKGKMIFLLMGIVTGVAAVVTLLSITESMSRDIEDRLDRFGANIVMAPKSDNLPLSYGGINVGGVSYSVREFDEKDLGRIREIKNNRNLGIVAPKVLGAHPVRGREVLIMGADLTLEPSLKTWWHVKGRFPSQADQLLVGADLAKALSLGLGDKVPMGEGEFTVSGILAPTGSSEDGIVIGDLHAMQKVLGKPGKISLVEISAFCRGCPISEMALQIAGKFPGAKVTALKQAVMAKMQSIEMIKTFSFGIALLVVFIGSLLVFVTMMGSVNERTREIGIFRAIGFRKGHIMQIVLLESMIVGFLGGCIGFFGGNLVAWGVIPHVIKGGSFAGVNPATGGMAVLIAVSLSLLASLYPARRASRLDPSDALRAL